MNCLRCNTENEEGAKFCKNCGVDMTYIPATENTSSKSSDTLLTIFIGVAFISTIAIFAIQKLVNDWYESPTKYIYSSLWLLQNLSFVLVPLSIKNKTLKIVGLIITAIMVIYHIYEYILWVL